MELRDLVAAHADDGRAPLPIASTLVSAEGRHVGAGDLLAVAGADVQQVGHCAEQGGQLDGLVGGAVLAGADGVVGGDVDDGEALEGAHADGGGGVDVEDEEGRGHGQEGAPVEGGEAVSYGTHGVLADAVVDVAARVGTV